MDKLDEKMRAWKNDRDVPDTVWNQYTQTLSSLPEKRPVKRTGFSFRMAAAVVCILALAGTGAYAAGQYFGILDFARRQRQEIPQEAEKLIDNQIAVSGEKETEDTIIDCTVLEALCDSQTITMVVEVSAKETGKYLFLPTDAMPEDSVAQWSTLSEQSAEEYAAEKGLTMVSIGGGISNRDELGIAEASMDFQSRAEDVMDIYIRCGKTEEGNTLKVNFTATAMFMEAEGNAVMKKNVTLTLQDRSETVTASYFPETPFFEGAADVPYEVERAEVIQTELGTYIDIFYSDIDGEASESSLEFWPANENGEVYEILGGSGRELQETGTYKTRLQLNRTEIGDRFLLEAYDYNTNEICGQIVMQQ
ncbi:MAG: hypothetical protein Q4E91_13065 [Lachnospiraceae bacterium]|nr:hypothetical protein [Lachnospiraceae bacterium]